MTLYLGYSTGACDYKCDVDDELMDYIANLYTTDTSICSNEFKDYAECVLESYALMYPPTTVSDALELLLVLITEMECH